MKTKLSIKKRRNSGDLQYTYSPLFNLISKDGEIKEFRTTELSCDIDNPITIDCQQSYDGTVNLIMNDDKNPPRLINTRFSAEENNTFRTINRNQINQSNLYVEGKIDSQTRLFRNINFIPKFDLLNVKEEGKLAGGNYVFYLKLADNDYNQTDVVSESGIVSIFKGSTVEFKSSSGTLLEEETNKSLELKISNIDTSFYKAYLYFSRDTSDLNGVLMNKFYKINRPYEIIDTELKITINGYEDITEISEEEINIVYNIANTVKTQTQNQNMLFFGNVTAPVINTVDLQNVSLYIPVSIKQKEESIGYVDYDYTSEGDDIGQSEYYNPKNIYYHLGYWPDELYRLGIVYIFNDDTTSSVFNLRGAKFNNLNDVNISPDSKYKNLYTDGVMNYIQKDDFIDNRYNYTNTLGVFENPKNISIFDNKETKPLYYEISLNDEIRNTLKSEYGIKGYFIVRQKRIPITICQGLSIGVDRSSYVPIIQYGKNGQGKSIYEAESFLSGDRSLSQDYNTRVLKTTSKLTSSILSLDACVVPQIQSLLDGSEFTYKRYKSAVMQKNDRSYYLSDYTALKSTILENSSIPSLYINDDISYRTLNNKTFSTRAGSEESVRLFSFFGADGSNPNDMNEVMEDKDNTNLLRGIYCPFIGLDGNLSDNSIYSIRVTDSVNQNHYLIRGYDNSPYFAISDRIEISDNQTLSIYRGDCFVNTVTMRIHRNFTDSETPTNTVILDKNCWKDNYEGMFNTDSGDKESDTRGWSYINKGDLNAIPIGTWVTYKCLSNYNLNLRSQDTSYIAETALMGNPRSFYPLSGNTMPAISNKTTESYLLNQGYCSTTGKKRYFIADNVPYIKDVYDNRIMFSNVQEDDAFRNSYRIFQGLSYKDIDRQYGSIVKLLPWKVHLFCVFEHGLAVIPINEKALIQTSTEQSIHMYGAGVIQNQLSLISPDFGSQWVDSIIRTPLGIYGVDTQAKKIWRVSESKGLELLSDFKVQSFLNENILLSEKDKNATVSLKNVKSHYNKYKNDVMFTFYNDDESICWNLCYNELVGKWTTRYSWTPLVSDNVNNSFYSMDKERSELLAYIYRNKNTKSGLSTSNNEWVIKNNPSIVSVGGYNYTDFTSILNIKGYDFYDGFEYKAKVISSYLNENNEEIEVVVDPNYYSINYDHNGDKRQAELIIRKAAFLYANIYPLFYFKIEFNITPLIKVSDTTDLKEVYTEDIDLVYNEDRDKTYIKTYSGDYITASPFVQNMGIIVSTEIPSQHTLMRNGLYIHGRASIIDELDYTNTDLTDNILPTKWYDKQESFEFEFVVSEALGMHKIFENLVVISNKVQPKSLEFELIGDVYDFNKAEIFKSYNDGYVEPNEYVSQEFKDSKILYDSVLNQYSILVNQDCKDIKTKGRLKGNIQYKEDSWYTVIEPIKYKRKTKKSEDNTSKVDAKYSSTRIRDKFLKIRVKYNGEDLAIISALKTLINLSYS